MSSRIDKIKEIIEANKNSSVSPLDILKPGTEWVLSKQCKKCGCFMAIKTKLQAATCPLGKW